MSDERDDRFARLDAEIDAMLAEHAARGDSIASLQASLVELERLIREQGEQLRAHAEELRRMSRRLEGDGR